jgi:hypothetical protein
VHARLYRPVVAEVMAHAPPESPSLSRHFAKLEEQIDKRVLHAKLVA